MNMREFLGIYHGCNELAVSVFDINTEKILESTTHYLMLNDGKDNDWKNAEIVSWDICEGTLYLNVDK